MNVRVGQPYQHDTEFAHDRVPVGEVSLHVVTSGSGPPVVLLHGFPESWYCWRHQLPALARAGFRAIAPDLRGYNCSDKPDNLGAYRIEPLAEDIAGLIRVVGAGPAAVVGHDWGGVIAWQLAMSEPTLVSRLVIVNAPHPERILRNRGNLRQLRRSWYVGFFQLPWLPEVVLRQRDFAAFRHVLRHEPVRSDAFSDQDIARYVDSLGRPGALTAALNYYRAAVRDSSRAIRSRLRRIDHPVLVVWGQQDRHLRPELARPSSDWVPDCRLERLARCSHWVPSEQPAALNRLLLEFLSPLR